MGSKSEFEAAVEAELARREAQRMQEEKEHREAIL